MVLSKWYLIIFGIFCKKMNINTLLLIEILVFKKN